MEIVPKLPIGGGEGDGEEGAGMASRPSRAARAARASTTGSRRESKRRTDGTGLYEPPAYEDQARRRIVVEKVTKVSERMPAADSFFWPFHLPHSSLLLSMSHKTVCSFVWKEFVTSFRSNCQKPSCDENCLGLSFRI